MSETFQFFVVLISSFITYISCLISYEYLYYDLKINFVLSMIYVCMLGVFVGGVYALLVYWFMVGF